MADKQEAEMYEAQAERMTRSCVGFVIGQRTVTHDYTSPIPDYARKVGRIDNPGYRERAWHGRDNQSVIEQMNKDLGPIPEDDYEIVE